MSFLEDFVEKNLILLENERAAEIEETQYEFKKSILNFYKTIYVRLDY